MVYPCKESGHLIGEDERPLITVINTPGFTSNYIMDFNTRGRIENYLFAYDYPIDLFLIAVDGQKDIPRALFNVLHNMFGRKMWLNSVIQVSHWKYDKLSVINRKHSSPPLTEHSIQTSYREYIVSTFNVTNATVPVTFIDPHYESWNAHATVPFTQNIDLLQSILYTNDSPYYYPESMGILTKKFGIIILVGGCTLCAVVMFVLYFLILYIKAKCEEMCKCKQPQVEMFSLSSSVPNDDIHDVAGNASSTCCIFLSSCV